MPPAIQANSATRKLEPYPWAQAHHANCVEWEKAPYDVIVVGAGLGGLVTAAYLACDLVYEVRYEKERRTDEEGTYPVWRALGSRRIARTEKDLELMRRQSLGDLTPAAADRPPAETSTR